jgi:transcriptional regulator with XRE-family HTH domain
MRLNEVVARNLRSIRTRQQLSQESLAARARISVSYVSMLERGQRSPPLETIEVLAEALGVRPVSLFTTPSGRPPNRAQRRG